MECRVALGRYTSVACFTISGTVESDRSTFVRIRASRTRPIPRPVNYLSAVHVIDFYSVNISGIPYCNNYFRLDAIS